MKNKLAVIILTWKDWKNEISWPAQLEFKDWALPDDFIFFTLDDWIEYSGAERININK